MDSRNYFVIFDARENKPGESVERFQSANSDKPDVRKSYYRLLDDLRIRRRVSDLRICPRGSSHDCEFFNLSRPGNHSARAEDLSGK